MATSITVVTVPMRALGTSYPFTRECPDCRAHHRTTWLYVQHGAAIRFVGGPHRYHVDFDKRLIGVTCDRCDHEFLFPLDSMG